MNDQSTVDQETEVNTGRNERHLDYNPVIFRLSTEFNPRMHLHYYLLRR